MSNKTQVNFNLNGASQTVVNSQLGTSTSSAESIKNNANKLEIGTILADKYKITGMLDAVTGEADLYLCNYNIATYVAKVYRRPVAVKAEVIAALKSIKCPAVSPVFEFSSYNGFPFEILPYYKNGSLEGKRYSYLTLKNIIIPSINEALSALHSIGIIHKDVKPTNIMLMDNNKDVVIIDFGISSIINEGNTVLVTNTGMTPEYSAPESFRNVFLSESDYYSFGITLYELFCGHTPYRNKTAEEITQYMAVQRIPFPNEMPQDLQDLITGITYHDLTNRNDKANPNRRWTYKEVADWCKGKRQVVPGTGTGFSATNSFPPYTFRDKQYTTLPTLVDALGKNWDEGKKQLYRGLLSGYFKGKNQEMANFCIDAEAEATSISGKDDFVFWKLLYRILPDMTNFYWKGASYESLPALGRDMLDKLWNGNENYYTYWDSILTEKLLSTFLTIKKSDNKALMESVQALEASHLLEAKDKRNRMMNYYLAAYLLSGQKILSIDGHQCRSVNDLRSFMKELLESSFESFETLCHRLINYEDVLDYQIEAWLISLGKQQEIEKWRQGLNS